VGAGDAPGQQHSGTSWLVPELFDFGDLVAYRRGAVDLNRAGRARDQDFVDIPHH
jgi:hypothetical protein